eukprot:1442700-Prymnesium_polylepis.1
MYEQCVNVQTQALRERLRGRREVQAMLRAHHGPAPQPCTDVLDAAAHEAAEDAGVAQQPAGGGRGRGGRAAAGR